MKTEIKRFAHTVLSGAALLLVIISAVTPPPVFADDFSDACFFIKSKWENERLYALDYFIEKDDERAVPFVLKAVGDKSANVRLRAARALVRLGHAEDRVSVPALLDQIAAEPDIKVLEELLYALGNFSESESASLSLKERFKGMQREHKYDLIDALIPLIRRNRTAYLNFFDVVKSAIFSNDEVLRLHAVINLGEFGEAEYILDLLLRTLTDKNDDIREVTCKYLGVLKPHRALNPLILRGLNDASPKVRRAAVVAVKNYKNPASFDFFKNIIQFDVDGETRGEAALALGVLGDRKAITLLKEALLDSANVVRLNSAYALTNYGNWDGEKVLVWFLWEQNLPAYRRRAVEGLAATRSRSVIPQLRRALSDWDDQVRDTAFYALREKWHFDITQ